MKTEEITVFHRLGIIQNHGADRQPGIKEARKHGKPNDKENEQSETRKAGSL